VEASDDREFGGDRGGARLHARGYAICPVKADKKPLGNDWRRQWRPAQQLVAEGKPIPFRPAAELFPLLVDTPFDDLCRSILPDGLQVPIVRHPDCSIFDGRNRYRACRRLMDSGAVTGNILHFRNWDPKPGETELDYVLAANLHRRHLNEAQRALIATQIANMPRGTPGFGAQENDQDGHAALNITLEKASKIMAVGERTVRLANRIREHASPEVVGAVKAGKLK
jgi:hypothetical protein